MTLSPDPDNPSPRRDWRQIIKRALPLSALAALLLVLLASAFQVSSLTCSRAQCAGPAQCVLETRVLGWFVLERQAVEGVRDARADAAGALELVTTGSSVPLEGGYAALASSQPEAFDRITAFARGPAPGNLTRRAWHWQPPGYLLPALLGLAGAGMLLARRW